MHENSTTGHLHLKNIILVLGYGTELTPKIEDYLDAVVMHVLQMKTPPECIVLCGGVTSPLTNPGLSEAEVMEDYLRERLPTTRFVREDCSITTQQNISFAADIFLRTLRVESVTNPSVKHEYHVTVFCNTAHALKVLFAMEKYFHKYCTFAIVMLPLDPRLSSVLLQVFIASPFDWLCLRWSALSEFKHMLKAAQIGNR